MDRQYQKRRSLNYFDPDVTSRSPPVPAKPVRPKVRRRTSLLEIAQRVSIGGVSGSPTSSHGKTAHPQTVRRGSKVRWLSKSEDFRKPDHIGNDVVTAGSDPELDLTSADLGHLSLLYKRSLARTVSQLSCDIDSPATTRRNYNQYIGGPTPSTTIRDRPSSEPPQSYPPQTRRKASVSGKSSDRRLPSAEKPAALSAKSFPRAPVLNVIVVKKRPPSARLSVSLPTSDGGQRVADNSRAVGATDRAVWIWSSHQAGPTQDVRGPFVDHIRTEPRNPVLGIAEKNSERLQSNLPQRTEQPGPVAVSGTEEIIVGLSKESANATANVVEAVAGDREQTPRTLRRTSSTVRFSVVEDAKMDPAGDPGRPRVSGDRRMSMYSYTSADYVDGLTERERDLEALREQLKKTIALAPLPPDISPDSDYNSHSSNQQSGRSTTSSSGSATSSSGSDSSDTSSSDSSSASSRRSSRPRSRSRKSRSRSRQSQSRSRKSRSHSRKSRSRSRKSISRSRKSVSRGRQSRSRNRSRSRSIRSRGRSSSGSPSASGSDSDSRRRDVNDNISGNINSSQALGDDGKVRDGAFLLSDVNERNSKKSSVCVIL